MNRMYSSCSVNCAALHFHRMSFPLLKEEGAGGALDPDIPNLALDIANR